MSRELVVNVQRMAIRARQPAPGLNTHSHRALQDASKDVQSLLAIYNLEDISVAAAAQIPYASMLLLSILGKAESATARDMSVTSTQGVPMFASLADGSEASRKGP